MSNTTHVGIIVGAYTNTIYIAVDPDDEARLDSPQWLFSHVENGEPLRMMRMLRADWMNGSQWRDGHEQLIAAKR